MAFDGDGLSVCEDPAHFAARLEVRQRGVRVTYSDPHIPNLRMDGEAQLCAEQLEPAIGAADAVVIITDHTSFDYERVVERAQEIVDTRNALKHFTKANIIRL